MNKRRFLSKFYFVLFTCLLILPCSKDVNGADWRLYFKGTGDVLFFYEADSINVLSNNIIRVLTKGIPQDEEGRMREITYRRNKGVTVPDDWSYTIDLWEINCKNRTSKILNVTSYTTNNEVISSTALSKHPSLEYISPDTMMEFLLKAVCTKKNLK
jgi:hypothetical protein